MNYGGGMDYEMSHGAAASAGIDNALLEAGFGGGGMGDGESREKAKVLYVCGGKSQFIA